MANNNIDDKLSYQEVIQFNAAQAIVSHNNKINKIDPLHTKLLTYFYNNQDKVISRRELMQQVWQSRHTSDDAINRVVSSLRKALGDNKKTLIKTVPKLGYQFSIPQQVYFEVIAQNNIESTATDTKPDPALNPSAKSTQSKTAQPANHSKPRGFNYLALIRPLIIFMLVVFTFKLITTEQTLISEQTTADQMPKPKPLTASTTKPVVNLAKVQAHQDAQIDKSQRHLLQEDIFNRLALNPHFDIIENSPSADSDYNIEVTLNQINHCFRLTFQVTSNTQKQKVLKALIPINGQPICQQNQFNQHASHEINAAIRIITQHNKRLSRYKHVLNTMDFKDLELLIQASYYAHKKVDNQNTQTKLNKLKQKYPNSADVLGLLAQSYLAQTSPDIHQLIETRQLAFNYAKQAQKLSPNNFDALKSLFYHHIGLEHLVEQTVAIGNDLIHYHPHEAESWRAVILHKIRSRKPCNEIAKTVEAIPTGVYSKRRLSTLRQILLACASNNPSAELNKLWHSPKQTPAIEKTISRNLYLFGLGFDSLPAVLEHQTKTQGNKARWIERYHTHVIIGDDIGTATLKDKMAAILSPNGMKMTQLIDFSYRVQSEPTDWHIEPQHYPLFYGPYEIYAVLHLIWQQQQTQTKTQNQLTDYLAKRPKFTINAENHNQAIALILAQFAQGEKTQSQATARKLFSQLEIYRQQHPHAYHFWQLPAYQFIALMYCGQQCKQFNDPLDELFSAQHLWWYDKHGLMTKILAPFADNGLVKRYLQKIKTDQQRALRYNGL